MSLYDDDNDGRDPDWIDPRDDPRSWLNSVDGPWHGQPSGLPARGLDDRVKGVYQFGLALILGLIFVIVMGLILEAVDPTDTPPESNLSAEYHDYPEGP